MAWSDEYCANVPAPSINPPKDMSPLEESLDSMGLMLSPVVIQDAQGNNVTVYAVMAKPESIVCDAIVCDSTVACE